MITGFSIAFLELHIFYEIVTNIKLKKKLSRIDTISYLWIMFTILTGIWEAAYIYFYDSVFFISNTLILENKHVWTNRYSLYYVIPWNLSKIFYAEYAAWADREYRSKSDDWSRIIESSHAILCGLLSIFAIYMKLKKKINNGIC